jgi:hypothetical protein
MYRRQEHDVCDVKKLFDDRAPLDLPPGFAARKLNRYSGTCLACVWCGSCQLSDPARLALFMTPEQAHAKMPACRSIQEFA